MSSDRTELLKLHDWDELLFGGFYCLHCTPDDEDSFDEPIAWPCQPLREAGVTDDEARALIAEHREKIAAEYQAKKEAEQAELQRRVDEFNSRYPVGTPVVAYPACRPEDHPGDRRLITRTRSKAQVLGGHTDVVWVDGHSACIALSHVDVLSEDEFKAARATETAAAVAEQGALPMPVGSASLSAAEVRLAQYGERAATFECGAEREMYRLASAMRDELDRTRAELAKYVGHEPTIAEEMQHLSSCLNAVRDLCNATEKQATRWEHPLPVPEWVADVREAADGGRPDDPTDRRRRVYIDGDGEAWLSLSSDREIRYIGKLAGAFDGDDTTDSVRERTGSLREIGRCW